MVLLHAEQVIRDNSQLRGTPNPIRAQLRPQRTPGKGAGPLELPGGLFAGSSLLAPLRRRRPVVSAPAEDHRRTARTERSGSDLDEHRNRVEETEHDAEPDADAPEPRLSVRQDFDLCPAGSPCPFSGSSVFRHTAFSAALAVG